MKPVSASALVNAIVQVFAPEDAGKTAAPASAGRDYGLDGMKVLLAEDNEINQQIAVELLEAVGVAVETADNGRLAVDRVKSGAPYDAVLMDLQMPELDGLSATGEIRGDARFANEPVGDTGIALGVGQQCLDGHPPLEFDVEAGEHRAHCTAADLGIDDDVRAEQFLQSVLQRVCRCRAWTCGGTAVAAERLAFGQGLAAVCAAELGVGHTRNTGREGRQGQRAVGVIRSIRRRRSSKPRTADGR